MIIKISPEMQKVLIPNILAIWGPPSLWGQLGVTVASNDGMWWVFWERQLFMSASAGGEVMHYPVTDIPLWGEKAKNAR